MRIALNGLFLGAPYSGTGQYLRELVSAMHAVAPSADLTLIAPRPDSTAPAPVLVRPTRLRSENFSKLEFEQLTFPRATRGFDLAHVPHFGSPLFPRISTVVTIHDLIPMVLPTYRGSWRVRLYTWLAASAAKRASAILADSQATARDIVQRLDVPSERVHVVPLATSARFHVPRRTEIERVRAKYRLPTEFVLYLGGIDVRKNIGRVIAAAHASDCPLILAGALPVTDSAFTPDPRRLISELGAGESIRCIGSVPEEDKPALYAAATVFAFPSRYEGFGLPPLEAMACGTPVIAANTSSLPEVVGSAGILLDPDDAAGWTSNLRELFQNSQKRAELTERGIAHAAKFSWERTARKTFAVYQSVV